jgi:hypothetical protein
MPINEALLRDAVANIERNPETFDMGGWILRKQCGTTMCLAGHVLAVAGLSEDEIWEIDSRNKVPTEARTLLGIDREQADALFSYAHVTERQDPPTACHCGCGEMGPGQRWERPVNVDDLKQRIKGAFGIDCDATRVQ